MRRLLDPGTWTEEYGPPRQIVVPIMAETRRGAISAARREVKKWPITGVVGRATAEDWGWDVWSVTFQIMADD